MFNSVPRRGAYRLDAISQAVYNRLLTKFTLIENYYLRKIIIIVSLFNLKNLFKNVVR